MGSEAPQDPKVTSEVPGLVLDVFPGPDHLGEKVQACRSEHDLVEGSVTARTATYPPALCHAFAECIMSSEVMWSQIMLDAQRSSDVVYANGVLEAEPTDDDDDDVARLFEGMPEPGAPPAENGEPVHVEEPAPEVGNKAEILRKIRTVHANLGHSSRDVMLRTLRDAQATPEVLELAKTFECTYCKQRGRTMLRKPSAPAKIMEKWHTVSVDTFWRQSLHKVDGQPKEHGVGISFLDEATDFHVACFVRVGSRKQSSVSSEEFRAHFSQDWIRIMPTPKIMRFDDEGFFRDHGLVEWRPGNAETSHSLYVNHQD